MTRAQLRLAAERSDALVVAFEAARLELLSGVSDLAPEHARIARELDLVEVEGAIRRWSTIAAGYWRRLQLLEATAEFLVDPSPVDAAAHLLAPASRSSGFWPAFGAHVAPGRAHLTLVPNARR